MSDWVDVEDGWEDVTPVKKKPTTNWKTDLALGFANVGNTVDTAGSMLGGALTRLVSPEVSDSIYKGMEERNKKRLDWANPDGLEQDFGGKAIGAIGTLPMQMLTMPLSSYETGKTAIDQGETLGKSQIMSSIDAVGNTLGLIVPAAKGASRLTKIASGAGMNAAQDTITKAAIAAIADNKTTKDILGPSWESAGLSGIIGAGFGAVHTTPKKGAKPTVDPSTIEDKIAAIKQAKETTSSATPVSEFEAAARKEAMLRYADDATVARLEHVLNKENKSHDTIAVDESGNAWTKDNQIVEDAIRRQDHSQTMQDATDAILADRQKALEDAVAYQRAREMDQRTVDMEQRGTGFNEWQDVLRNNAETRQPGNNAPMDLGPARLRNASQYPDVNDFPSLLQDAPYQHENGIDYTQPRDQAALPVEIADTLRVGDRSIDPFNRYSPNQAARRILIEGEQPPIIKGGQRRGQSGGVDFKGIEDSIKSLWRKAEKSPYITAARQVEDKIATPRSEETVGIRNDLAKKERAVGLTNQYQRVTTLEQAESMIDPSADISKYSKTPVRSGAEAVLRTNVRNGPVNFIRSTFQEARNKAEVLSKQYITGPMGVVSQLRKLSQEEKNGIAAVLQAADKHQVELADEHLQSLGLNDAQVGAIKAIREMLDTRYAEAMKAAGKEGYEGFQYRKGYIPSMFSGAYVKFVGFTDKNGKWVTKGIAQADSKKGLEAALAEYAKQGYTETVDGSYRGLKDSIGTNRVYNGFAAVVARFAELDGDFAKAKAIADQASSDTVRALYRFDTHELKKSGVRGALGDRPWLDRDQNTNDLLKAVVDYAEEGFRYDALQSPLMDAAKLASNPKLIEQMPNTAKFIEEYAKHVSGQDLNAFGAAGNRAINLIADGIFGQGPAPARNIIGKAQSISTSFMMGFGNVGFMAMQLTQPFTGGLPEVARVRAATGLGAGDLATSLTAAPLHTIALVSGKDGYVPQHLKKAFQWGKDRGIFDFSEAELVHELGMSEKARMVKKVVNSSIEYSEKMTRPPMFMIFADMFHKAGYRGEEAYQRAQAATDYSMTNYHPDERPALYSGLGEIGSLLSALSTYKHSFMEQTISTGVNAKREPAAALVYLAIAASLYGVSGMPGYPDADKVVQGLTKKSIREFLLDDPTKASKVMDGLASWYSGYDISSRVSTSQILPDPTHPTSVAPHIQNILGVLGAALDAGVKHDTASFQELARKGLPASARNIYEDMALTDNQGWVENTRGQVNVEQPRTEEQRALRRGLGLRPLQEKLDSETLWTRQKAHVARQEKLKAAEKDIASSHLLKDGPGLNRAIGRYLDAGGDPEKLQNKQYWENIAVQGNLTPSQRAAGINPQSWDSVQRSLDFRK